MQQSLSTLFLSFFLLAPLTSPAQDFQAYDPVLAGMGNEEPPNVARMSDSDLTCEQLYAESAVIEQRLARMPKPEDPMALASRMQSEMMDEVQKQQAAMRARSVASSVLSMVPGVGGLAASALGPGGVDSSHMDEQMARYTKQVQQMQVQMRAVAEQQARHRHVTNLFLSRACKVSALDPLLVQAARRQLDGTGATDSGASPPRAPMAAVQDAAAGSPDHLQSAAGASGASGDGVAPPTEPGDAAAPPPASGDATSSGA
jgi:hypothetical protein